MFLGLITEIKITDRLNRSLSFQVWILEKYVFYVNMIVENVLLLLITVQCEL